MEDYSANRKGKQGMAGGGLFGATTPATQAANTGFSFGQPAASSTSGFSKYCILSLRILLSYFQ